MGDVYLKWYPIDFASPVTEHSVAITAKNKLFVLNEKEEIREYVVFDFFKIGGK
ncbi:MAG: hypothetical protein ACJAX4_004556 [Clostridium sp.]